MTTRRCEVTGLILINGPGADGYHVGPDSHQAETTVFSCFSRAEEMSFH